MKTYVGQYYKGKLFMMVSPICGIFPRVSLLLCFTHSTPIERTTKVSQSNLSHCYWYCTGISGISGRRLARALDVFSDQLDLSAVQNLWNKHLWLSVLKYSLFYTLYSSHRKALACQKCPDLQVRGSPLLNFLGTN